MSWWNLIDTKKTVNNVMDKDNGLLSQVGGWVGNMNFTDEEKAKMDAQMIEGVSSFVKMTLSENTERSKTRRSVAVMWIKAQLAMVFITMMVAPFNEKLATFYVDLTFSSVMTAGTLAIIGFFFGAHMLSSHMGFSKKKSKGE